MAQFPSLTLTQAGIEMIATSQGGAELIFTCMKMGEGDSTGVEIMELEDLIAPKITINISTIDTSGTPGQISLTATVSNADLDNGFFTKELGVFAKIGSSGTEKLYAYTNAGSLCDYMPSKATPIDENTIRATMVVANNANTTAIIDSSVVYVTAAEVNARISAHNADASAHSAAIGAHNTATDAHANRFANYLPLAGGGMSGNIRKTSDDSSMVLFGGSVADAIHGGYITLFGKSHAQQGSFELVACNGTDSHALKGNASGDLTWGKATGTPKPIKSMAFPSATSVNVPSLPYTAPANGFISIHGNYSTSSQHGDIYVNSICVSRWDSSITGYGFVGFAMVKKGDVIDAVMLNTTFFGGTFTYAEGEV